MMDIYLVIKKLFFITNYDYYRTLRYNKVRNRQHVVSSSSSIVFVILLFNLFTIVSCGETKQSAYRLIGLNSYAQYLQWQPCLNGSLQFEFKTHEPNGLLFYAQNSLYKYIQLSLSDGTIRMRFRISEKDDPRGVFLVHNVRLNDEKWHNVEIKRSNERTLLLIDGTTYYHVHKGASLEGYDLYFGDPDQSFNSYLLVFGGLPEHIQTYDLALSTAYFEQRFNGYIRNVRALNCTSTIMKLDVQSNNGLRYVNEIDLCASNPCLNNGVCLLTDSSFQCDCSFTKYEGKLCDKLKPPQSDTELTFNGKDYLSFEIPTGSTFATTYEEEFYLEFKTSRSTGLLSYAGDAQDYFVFGLQDGGLYVKFNIKGQVFEKTLTISGTYLHNNHWHSVKIARKLKQIEIIIDNMKKEYGNLSGDFIAMYTRVVYLGGVPKQNTIYRTIKKNFIGCLRNVTFRTDIVSLNLIQLALNYNKLNQTLPQKSCSTITDPITFSSPGSYIPIYEWKDSPKIYSFTMEFQTTENDGVLAYILGAPKNGQNVNIDSMYRDFFALEIHDRFLNAYINLGSTYYRHEVVQGHVSSGRSHQIQVEFNDKYVIFKFDQKPETTIKLDSGDGILNLIGPLVIGGIHPNHTSMSSFSNPSNHIPPYFYSGVLNHGYVGCVQDVEINGQFVNLTYYANKESISGIRTDICNPMPNQCDIGHCMNDGVCSDGWNRFKCDCSFTGYNGPICDQPATIANFADGQFLRIKYEPEWITEAEHISFRFKTNRKQNSILLSTYSANFRDFMEISLENSQIRLFLKIGNIDRTLYSGSDLTDNNWHTVKIIREGSRLILQVDGNEPATGSFKSNESIKPLNDLQLHFLHMDVGTSIFYENNKYFTNITGQKALSYDSIDLGARPNKNKAHSLKHLNSFEGQMQQLIINGKSYFELVDNNDIMNHVNSTVTFVRGDLPHKYPVTFQDTKSWFELPKIDAFHILLIQFHFKTIHENGLIMYNHGQNDDYLAVELVDGQIHYRFSLGTGVHQLKSSVKNKLNDNKWHLVSIWRSTKTDHDLSVDSLSYKHSLQDDKYLVFNLIDNLYIGGLKNDELYSQLKTKHKIHSTHGFQGCLASLEINGRIPDFDEIWSNENKMKGNISKGCESPMNCKPNTCKNNGICIQKWEQNEVKCNCELTTYTGKTCQTKSRGFNFGSDGGLIIYENKVPFNWNEDLLVFAVETQDKDSILFHAQCPLTNKTVIAEIVDGYIQITYNINGVDYVNAFKSFPINDSKYHVIKFRRNSMNSTLQIDSAYQNHEIPINTKKTQNDEIQSPRQIIQIGGTTSLSINEIDKQLSSKQELPINSKFNGNIYGLVYNKIRILDLASQHDNRVSTTGKITHIKSGSKESIDSINNSDCEYKNDCLTTTTQSVNINEVIVPETKDENLPIKTDSNHKITTFSSSTTTNKIESSMDSTKKMDTLTTNATILNDPKTLDNSMSKTDDSLNIGVIIGIAVASLIALIIIIYAFYKYRNRDEGTYTIDETKNFGPFADLDMSINDTNTKKSSLNCKNSKQSKKVNKNPNSMKEWYV